MTQSKIIKPLIQRIRRVTGYLVKPNTYNPGKQEEINDRVAHNKAETK